ncbi:MAG: dihydrofolate reductase family protein [Acidimicrobiales bacterium]
MHSATVSGSPRPSGSGELTDADLERLYSPPAVREYRRASFVASADGAIEVGDRVGPLGSADDRRVLATLRALADVVLVGAETVRREDYGPILLPGDRLERRLARGQGPAPVVAVVSGRAALDPGSRLLAGGGAAGRPPRPRPIVFTCEASDPLRRRALAGVAEVVVCGAESVDLAGALGVLAARDHGQVLCEGGPMLLTQLLAGGHVDEICLTSAPVLAGPGRRTMTVGAPFASPVPLVLGHLLVGDGALLARYLIDRHSIHNERT